jgi:hypothetical protein
MTKIKIVKSRMIREIGLPEHQTLGYVNMGMTRYRGQWSLYVTDPILVRLFREYFSKRPNKKNVLKFPQETEDELS